MSFREISKYICKDPSTVSKEVWKHRVVNTWNRGSFNNPYNFCIHRYHRRKTNACDKLIICDTKCRSCHRCNAKAARRRYEELLKSSREGIDLTKKELHQIDRVVRPLIEQGQSPYMILTNHPELGLSVTTLYNYIDRGVLLTKNIDPKRKVKFKKRTVHDTQIKNREVFVGRTDNDFKNDHADEMDFWEMDTVKSAKGSWKCILTVCFPEFELLIGRLMNRCTPGAVRLEFERIQKSLGDAMEFEILFPVILTDRGGIR